MHDNLQEKHMTYPPYDQLSAGTVLKAQALLKAVGMELNEHSKMTPFRLTHYLQYLVEGSKQDQVHWTAFPNEDPVVDHMVVVPQIPFWSACSHHCLPFIGKASVGYVPNNLLFGLSKIPLLVRWHARGLWLQEHLANAIADHLEMLLCPRGVAVYIEAQHTCQLLDLKEPPIPVMKTSVLRGVLMHGEKARDEFYRLI